MSIRLCELCGSPFETEAGFVTCDKCRDGQPAKSKRKRKVSRNDRMMRKINPRGKEPKAQRKSDRSMNEFLTRLSDGGQP